MEWNSLVTAATEELELVLAGLPMELRVRAVALPITFEPVPSADLIADGIEPDVMGLFVGPEFAQEDMVPMPPQIILFLNNLWEVGEGDWTNFREEVRVTLLHELGHYLGLDEDGLIERGLE
jgi:predicted Zn-dependent protease with MMP-like domain